MTSLAGAVLEGIAARLEADDTLRGLVGGIVPGSSPFIPLAKMPVIELVHDTASAPKLTATEIVRLHTVSAIVTNIAPPTVRWPDESSKVAALIEPYRAGMQITDQLHQVVLNDRGLRALSGSTPRPWLTLNIALGDTEYADAATEQGAQQMLYYQWLTKIYVEIKEARGA